MNAKNVNLWSESLEVGFLAWIEKHSYSDKTRKTYQSMIFSFFSFLREKNISIESSNKTVVEQFFKSRVLSDKTKRSYLWLISDIFDNMVDVGFIAENNMAIVLEKFRQDKRGKSAKRLPTFLNNDEVALLLKYISSLPRNYSKQRERSVLLLLLGTGLRVQELCDLKSSNVYMHNDPAYVTVIGKFNKERMIPIPEAIVNELLTYRDMRLKPSKFFISSMKNSNPYVPSTVYRMVKSALLDAGIIKPKLSPHVLRHTYCTRQLASGNPLEVVKNWMGHESIATTAIYEHIANLISSGKPTL